MENVIADNGDILDLESAAMAFSYNADGTNIEPDCLILMRIARIGSDVADTFPDSVWGATADLHYQANVKGTLNKAPNFYE